MDILHRFKYFCSIAIIFCTSSVALYAQEIMIANSPAQLDIRVAGSNSLRVTLKPVSFKDNYPYTPAVVEKTYPAPVISLREITKAVKKKVGNFIIEVSSSPLTVVIKNAKGQKIQHLVFENNGNLSFELGDQPILGMGEGGPKPQRGIS